ncbi:MAG: cyanophycinase [Nannocystis sp.]|nr:cyanophycinase [Nannocystis sp.]MBA3548076.1 cyanophycinase [Nannocystis sp.]
MSRFAVLIAGSWVLFSCGGAPAGTDGASSETGAGEGSAAPTTLADVTGSSGQVSSGTTAAAPTTSMVSTGTSTGTASTGTSTGTASTGDTTSAGEGPRPDKPAGLESYLSGADADADIQPNGPGLIVMGGGTDVDEAFMWQLKYAGGGDVVVLRTSGADGYNDYLFAEIGGVDSVETLLVTSETLANEPYVAWTIAHAEAVFMAGGDQATYLNAWKGTPVQDAIMAVWARGGVIGGTSAGAAVLGEFIYAAYNDSVIEDEALLDPYNQYMTFEREFLALPPLVGVITDTHFTARRRLCRLIGFVARMVEDGWGEPVLGVGVDEQTALVVDPAGLATVLGVGKVHLLRSAGAPQQCVTGKTLEYADLELRALEPGDSVQLPGGAAPGAATLLSASMGALDPAYDCID